MMYMAHLDANLVTEINLNDNEDEEDHQEEEPGTCSSFHCQLIISGMSPLSLCFVFLIDHHSIEAI